MSFFKKTFSLWIVLLMMLGVIQTQTVEAAGKLAKGSTIAEVLLEDLTLEEAKQLLQEEISIWQAGEPLIAKSQHESIEIPRNLFQFDVDASLHELEEKTKRHWSNFFMKQKNINLYLIVDIPDEAREYVNWPANVDVGATLNNGLVQASKLTENQIALIYTDEAQMELEKIAEVSLLIPDISKTTISYLVEKLNGQTIESSSLFSFLETMTLLDGMANSEEETSFLASGIYTLVLQTNMEIIERHQQKTIASYTEPGLQAEVNREKGLDLKLHNTNNYSYEIQAAINNDELQLSIHAVPTSSAFDYVIENKIEIEPRKIYRYSKILQPGEEKVIQEGKAGLQLEVYRTKSEDGSDLNRELITRDFYPPIPEIIEVAVEQPEEASNADEAANSEQPAENYNIGSIIEKVNPSNNHLYLDCEEDPSKCESDSDTDLTTLLLACMMENQAETGNENGEDDLETSYTVEQNKGMCDLLLFYLILDMFGNGENPNLDMENEMNLPEDLLTKEPISEDDTEEGNSADNGGMK